jgi:transporter family-2 protein
MSQDPSPFILGVAIASVVAGGVAISVQSPINATLNRALGDPLLTACVSFGVGFVALICVWLGSLAIRGQGFSMPDTSAFPWWIWIGGCLGTVYVFAALWSVPKIGVVTLVAAVVFGQLMAALIMDATGAFGLVAREITPMRLLAVAMVMGGLLVSRY